MKRLCLNILSRIEGEYIVAYQISTRQKFYLPFKRAIDIFGSTLGIIVLSPVLIICALLTKLTSKGPVFFRQSRYGKDQKVFRIFKFRSMMTTAKLAGAEDVTDEERAQMVTKWGKFMRKTSLDEIPQLFNVFVGDMSFIGPRPCMSEGEEELTQARLSTVPTAYAVKPGISGMAQIYLHRDHDPVKKAEYDSLYVRTFNFWLDTKLFLMSFLVALGFYKGK